MVLCLCGWDKSFFHPVPVRAGCEQLWVELQDLLVPLVPWFIYCEPRTLGWKQQFTIHFPVAPPPDVGPKTSLSSSRSALFEQD